MVVTILNQAAGTGRSLSMQMRAAAYHPTPTDVDPNGSTKDGNAGMQARVTVHPARETTVFMQRFREPAGQRFAF